MDPNEVVGTPTEREMWLSPDWTKRGASQSAAGPGATKVSVRTVTYRNGRQVTYVLDENREPVKHPDGNYAPALTETIDADVKRAWDAAQTQAGRGDQEGDIRPVPATSPIREVYRGGKWVTEPNPLYQAPTGSGAREWRPEGTPDGRGGFDNNQLTMAEYINGKRTGVTRAPDDKELRSWNNAREMSRNPGGRTDAEIAAQRDKDKAEADRQAQQNRPAVTIREDGSGGLVSISTDPRTGQSTTSPIPGVRGTPQQVKGPDGVTYERQPDGTYKPAAGIPAPRKGGKLPPGVNPPQFSRGNVAKELARFNAELDAAVSRGEITKEEATGFYTPYHQEGATYLQEQNYGDTQDQNAVSSQLTQRSQNMTQAGNRMNWSNSAFQNAANQDQNLLMGAAGTGKSALVPLLALQAGLTNAAGGFREQPEVEVRRYPAMGAPVPASIAPVINATNAAPSSVSAGMSAPVPKPTASADAVTAEAVRQQQAASGGAATGTPAMAPLPPTTPQRPVIAPTQQPTSISAASAAGVPAPAINPVTGEPTGLSPLPVNGGFPDAPPNGQNQMPVNVPYPDNAGAQSMMPRSIQPAMPGQQQARPDIEAITAKMLADGVNPMDVMEIRRRWSGQAA